MKILVLNCGSSSLKYQIIDMETQAVLCKGLCERIGIDGSKLTHKVPGKDNLVKEEPMPDHKRAVEMVMEALRQCDEVAYVRFASVYRSFTDIPTFMEELQTMLNERIQEKSST